MSSYPFDGDGDQPQEPLYRVTQPPAPTQPKPRVKPTTEMLQKHAVEQSLKYGVDPALTLALLGNESSFNPNAVSPKGARNVGQVMPGTARTEAPKYGLDPNKVLTDPFESINFTVRHLDDRLSRYGDVESALRAYNAGDAAIEKSKKYPETNNYVAAIRKAQDAYAQDLAPQLATFYQQGTESQPVARPTTVDPNAPNPVRAPAHLGQEAAGAYQNKPGVAQSLGREVGTFRLPLAPPISRSRVQTAPPETAGETPERVGVTRPGVTPAPAVKSIQSKPQVIMPQSPVVGSRHGVLRSAEWAKEPDISDDERAMKDSFEMYKSQGDLQSANEFASKLKNLGWEVGEQDGWPYVKPPASRARVIPNRPAQPQISVTSGRRIQPGQSGYPLPSLQQQVSQAEQDIAAGQQAKPVRRADTASIDPRARFGSEVLSTIGDTVGETLKGVGDMMGTDLVKWGSNLPPEFQTKLSEVTQQVGKHVSDWAGRLSDETGMQEGLSRDIARGGTQAALALLMGMAPAGEAVLGLQSGLETKGKGASVEDAALAGLKSYLGMKGMGAAAEKLDQVVANPVLKFAGRTAANVAVPRAIDVATGESPLPKDAREAAKEGIFAAMWAAAHHGAKGEGQEGRLRIGDAEHSVQVFPEGTAPSLRQLKAQGMVRTDVDGMTVVHPSGLKYGDVRNAVRSNGLSYGGEMPPVPETSETLDAQMQALRDGRKSAVLVTPGAEMPASAESLEKEGFQVTPTKQGTFIHNESLTPEEVRDAAENDTHGGVLDYLKPKPRDGEPSVTVVARDQAGRELQSAVTKPEDAAQQAAKLQEVFPGATVGAEHPAQVIGERVAGQMRPADTASVVQRAQERVDSGQAVDDYAAQFGPGAKDSRGWDISASNARTVLAPEARTSEGLAEHGEALTDTARRLAEHVYFRALEDPKATEVVISLGGTSTGKTSAHQAEAQRRGSIVFESHGEDVEALTAMIQEALDRGKQVTVNGITREPGASYESTIERFKSGEQAGKVVPLDRAAQTHATAPAAFAELKRRFGGDVDFRAIDNTGQVPLPARSMPTVSYEEARNKMSDVLDRAHREGRLSDDEYSKFSGGQVPVGVEPARSQDQEISAQAKEKVPQRRGEAGKETPEGSRVEPVTSEVIGQSERRVSDQGPPEGQPERRGAIVSESEARVSGPEGAVKRAREGERRAKTEGAIDALTGLQSQSQWLGAKSRIEADPNLAIARLDFNDLKKVNDQHGHEAGDAYIRRGGEIAREEAQKAGLAARGQFRTGGDEFTLTGPAETLQKVAEAVQKRVSEEIELPTGQKGSVAIGVDKTEADADEKMYAQKREMKAARNKPETKPAVESVKPAKEKPAVETKAAMKPAIKVGDTVSHPKLSDGKPLKVTSVGEGRIMFRRTDTGKEFGVMADSRIGRELQPLGTEPAQSRAEKGATGAAPGVEVPAGNRPEVAAPVDTQLEAPSPSGVSKQEPRLPDLDSLQNAVDRTKGGSPEERVAVRDLIAGQLDHARAGLADTEKLMKGETAQKGVRSELREKILTTQRQNVRELEDELATHDAETKAIKDIKGKGIASIGDRTAKIVEHPSGKGYGVEMTIAGDRRLPLGDSMTLKEAREEAARLLTAPEPGQHPANYQPRTEDGKFDGEPEYPPDDERAREPRKFSSTQINLSKTDAEPVLAFGRMIPDRDLAADGRELESHVTLKFGLHTSDVEDVRPLLEGEGPIKATLGKTKVFEGVEDGTADAVVVEVKSPDLERLNKKVGVLEHTDTHPDYQPHLTIAYVKPGLGKKYVGRTDLEGKKISVDEVMFSGKDRTETPISVTSKVGKGKDETEHVGLVDESKRETPRGTGEDQARSIEGRVESTGGERVGDQENRETRSSGVQESIGGEDVTTKTTPDTGRVFDASTTGAVEDVAEKPITDVKSLRDAFKEKFKLSDEEADSVSAVADAHAEAWAKLNGKEKGEWYQSRLADVTSGETLLSEDALEQRRKNLTKTPEFKEWFGDSKITDNKGRPLVVYHGTTNRGFESFETGKRDSGRMEASPQNNFGFFFTPDSRYAELFGEPQGFYLKVEKPYEMHTGEFYGYNHDWTPELVEQTKSRLQGEGYDGLVLKTKDGQVHEIIVFDPTQIKSPGNRGTFDPSDPNFLHQGPKGATQFLEDGRAIIHAFESADVSTAAHELGHVFRRDLPVNDLKVAEEWAGVKDGEWKRVHEEKFARGFEKYLSDGEAPNEELKGVFEKFKTWLQKIYQRITGSEIDVKISDPMRQVFDRMLGGEGNVTSEVTGEKYKGPRDALRQTWEEYAEQYGVPEKYIPIGSGTATAYNAYNQYADEVIKGFRAGSIDGAVASAKLKAMPGKSYVPQDIEKAAAKEKPGPVTATDLFGKKPEDRTEKPAGADEGIPEPQWWKERTTAGRADILKGAGIKSTKIAWHYLSAETQRALDRQWGKPAAQPSLFGGIEGGLEPAYTGAKETGDETRAIGTGPQGTSQGELSGVVSEPPEDRKVERPRAPSGVGREGTRTEATGTGSEAARSEERRSGAVHLPDAGERGIAGTVGGGRRSEQSRSGDRERVELYGKGSATEDQRAPASHVPGDYHIARPEDLTAGGAKSKLRANIAALETLHKIENEDRPATAEEQAILSRYSGWGQFPVLFNEDNPEFAKERERVREILGNQGFDAARQSILNAHFTSPEVVDAMWRGVEKMGYRNGRVLEPSMGIGNFFGLMPLDLRGRSQLTGVELEGGTGRMAQLLYPSANIQIKGFEDLKVPNDWYDVAIGNVPFGSYGIFDKDYAPHLRDKIHDYFFVKGIDKVKPGGVMAFITSTGTLDKADGRVRRYLGDKADLVAAIRLPENTFGKSAGTAVVTDLVVLRKRLPGEKPGDMSWLRIGKVEDPDGGADIPINQYYVEHPEQVMGVVDRKSRLYGSGDPHVSRSKDFEERFKDAIDRLPENIVKSVDQPAFEPQRLEAPGEVKQGGYKVQEGKLYRREGDHLVEQEAKPLDVKRMSGLLKVRDAVRDVFNAQLQGEGVEAATKARQRLGSIYSDFVDRHGNINTRTNRRLILDDPDGPLLLSLETRQANGKYVKSDVFRKDTIRPFTKATTAETPGEALGVSLHETGRIDMDRVGELLGMDRDAAVDAMSKEGLIFHDPSRGWVVKDQYLSGNVRQKLVQARQAAEIDPAYRPNVEALEKVQPEDIPYSLISVHVGAPWIAPEDMEAFMAHMLDGELGEFKAGYLGGQGQWVFSTSNYRHQGSTKATEVWGTRRAPFLRVLESATSGNPIAIYDTVGRERVFNPEESANANLKVQDVKDAFEDWIWQDEARRDRLERYYNDNFNNVRTIEYNADHYKDKDGNYVFPGMNPAVQLYPHQANAIWQVVSTGRGLLAHEVGTGKTYTMVAAAMELKRLGLANKPAIAVPKAIVKQFESAARELYPAARIITTADRFEAKQRKETVARVATGDYDLAILTHPNLDMLPMHQDVVRDFIGREMQELEDAIRAAKEEGGDDRGNRIVKQLEAAKEKLEVKLREAIEGARKDNVVNFEETGIDHLFVDEAHKYKSLPVYSTLARTKGIPQSRSDRATNMLMRTQWLQAQNGGRGVVFATGTPVQNTMAEMFNMQRYLQMGDLEERGLQSFDAWRRNFADVQNTMEFSASGTYQPTSRLSKFVNIPELMNLSRQMMDVRFVDDDPEMAKRVQRPPRVDHVVTVPMSDAQREFLADIQGRAEAIKRNPKNARPDNMLSVSTDGRKMAMDMRLVRQHAEQDEENKISRAIDNVVAIHREHPTVTQMIFSDIGVSPTTWGFSLYRSIKDRLVEQGIPADKIIDFSKIKTDEEKDRAAQRLREGDALVAIGSSDKMGTGVNAQQYLYAVHHIDAPWLPGQVEQRNGRIWRQGNTSDQANIYTYTTEASFDQFMWQLLSAKTNFIRQIMRGKADVREYADEDTEAISPAKVMAITSGDPRLLQRINLQEDVSKLERGRRQHEGAQMNFRRVATQSVSDIAATESRIEAIKADAEQVASQKSDKFSMVVGGKTYTDRAEASKALTTAQLTYYMDVKKGREPKAEKIADYKGFEIYPSKWEEDGIKIRGNYDYGYDAKAGTGAAASIDGVLRNVASKVGFHDRKLEELKRNQAAAQAEIGKPYKKVAELEEKRVALQKLEDEISGKVATPVARVDTVPIESDEVGVAERRGRYGTEKGPTLFDIIPEPETGGLHREAEPVQGKERGQAKEPKTNEDIRRIAQDLVGSKSREEIAHKLDRLFNVDDDRFERYWNGEESHTTNLGLAATVQADLHQAASERDSGTVEDILSVLKQFEPRLEARYDGRVTGDWRKVPSREVDKAVRQVLRREYDRTQTGVVEGRLDDLDMLYGEDAVRASLARVATPIEDQTMAGKQPRWIEKDKTEIRGGRTELSHDAYINMHTGKGRNIPSFDDYMAQDKALAQADDVLKRATSAETNDAYGKWDKEFTRVKQEYDDKYGKQARSQVRESEVLYNRPPAVLYQEQGGLTEAAKDYLDSLNASELRKAVRAKDMGEEYRDYARQRLEESGLETRSTVTFEVTRDGETVWRGKAEDARDALRQSGEKGPGLRATKVGPSEEQKAAGRSVIQTIIAKGGLDITKPGVQTRGELKSLEINRPGFFNKDSEYTPHKMAEELRDSGFLMPDGREPQDEHDLVELIDREMRQGPQYSTTKEYDPEAEFDKWQKSGMSEEDAQDYDLMKHLQENEPEWIDAAARVRSTDEEPSDEDLQRFRELSAAHGLSDDAIEGFIDAGREGREGDASFDFGANVPQESDAGETATGREGEREPGQREGAVKPGLEPLFAEALKPKLRSGADKITEDDHWNFGRSEFSSPESEEAFRNVIKNAAVESGGAHKVKVTQSDIAAAAENILQLHPEAVREIAEWRPGKGEVVPSVEAVVAAAKFAQSLTNEAVKIREQLFEGRRADGTPLTGDEIEQMETQAARYEHDAGEVMVGGIGVRSQKGRELSLLKTVKPDNLGEWAVNRLSKLWRNAGKEPEGKAYAETQAEVQRLTSQIKALENREARQKRYIDELQGNRPPREKPVREKKKSWKDNFQDRMVDLEKEARDRLTKLGILKPEPPKGESVLYQDEQKQETKKQTETLEFKRWFGDSKVVDENGEPLVVYHGTKADVSEFKQSADGGIHFARIPAQASMRVSGEGKNLIPAYLSIQNPRRSRDTGGSWRKQIESAKGAGNDGIVYLNRYEGISLETTQRAQRDGVNLDKLNDAQFRKYVPEASDSFIAFEPTQIKSATGNRSTFDPNDPNILYQMPDISADIATVMAAKLARSKPGEKSLEDIRQEMREEFGEHYRQERVDELAHKIVLDERRTARLAATKEPASAPSAQAALGKELKDAEKARRQAVAELERTKRQSDKAWALEQQRGAKEREKAVSQNPDQELSEAEKQAQIDRAFDQYEAKQGRQAEIEQEKDAARVEKETAAALDAEKYDQWSADAKAELRNRKLLDQEAKRQLAEEARERAAQARKDAAEGERNAAQALAREKREAEKRARDAQKWETPVRLNAEAATIRLSDPDRLKSKDAVEDLAQIMAGKLVEPGMTPQKVRTEMMTYGKTYTDNQAEIHGRATKIRDDAKIAGRQAELERRATTPKNQFEVVKNGKRVWSGQAVNMADALSQAKAGQGARARRISESQSGTMTPEQLEEAIKDYQSTIKQKQVIQRQLVDAMDVRTVPDKVMDFIKKVRRAIVLSGVSTIGKLTGAASGRIALTPVEEGIGTVLAQIPGVKQIAAKAPREGSMSGAAEKEALSHTFSKEMPREAWEALKTGKGHLEKQWGKPDDWDAELGISSQPSIIDLFGRIHGALKTPAMVNEFYRSLTKRSEAVRRQQEADGRSDAEIDRYLRNDTVHAKIAGEALKDAYRAKLQNDNQAVQIYRGILSWVERHTQRTDVAHAFGKAVHFAADMELPVVKIPANFMAESTSYAAGSLKALGQLLASRGVKNMTPEQADYFMRNVKKQVVGGLMAAAFFALPGGVIDAGGYYQEGDNKDKKKPKAGTLRLFGWDVPRWMAHIPALEALQIAATVRNVYDKAAHKGEPKGEAIAAGTLAAGVGLIREVPFIEQPIRLMEDFKNWQGAKRAAGQQVAGMVTPPDLRKIAAAQDQPSGSVVQRLMGEPTPRKPEGFLDEIKMGIPGLRKQVPIDENRPRLDAIRNIYAEIDKGTDRHTVEAMIRDAVHKGLIPQREASLIERQKGLSEVQREFVHMNLKAAAKRWAAMKPEERNSVRPILMRKIGSAIQSQSVPSDLRPWVDQMRAGHP